MPFECFNRLVAKFKKAPLSDESAGYATELLFSAANRESDKRVFVDWKMVMTAFTLLMSAVPTSAQLNDYISNLKKQGDLVSLPNFLQVSIILINYISLLLCGRSEPGSMLPKEPMTQPTMRSSPTS